jgi:uncharacterized protein YbbC (DUF1343 family)/CubicO group peptidase (beta-lactamase class C family)
VTRGAARTASWLLALVLVLAAAAPAPAAEAPDFGAVDEAARDAVASGEIPGAVVLVGRGDETLYHRAFGFRSLVPEAAPMRPDTIFDIASLTKPVGTALAVMSLVERGTLSLEAPVGRYLREFRGAAFREITIRRLLTHSAGLVAYPPNASVKGGFPRAVAAIAKLKLDYPPGSGFQYSDTGFILLGEVVRRVAGEPLDRHLGRVLFRPLGLADTSFDPPARVHDRIAPTEFHQGRMLQGQVHDPRARLLGGVTGHAGMFSTAADLARICRMLLDGGALDGRRILRADTVRLMWARAPDGNGKRTLGWDMSSGFSVIMAPFFPAGSVGHTGFTGTSIWIDPSSRTYLILLTNRVHPSGGSAARIRELRVRVAAAVGAALFHRPVLPVEAAGATAAEAPNGGEAVPPPPAANGRVRSGLDVLVDQDFAVLRGQSVGLVTNQTGIDGTGRRAIDLLAAAPDVRLAAIFSPEHGLSGAAETDVPHGRDAATGRPIWSLYGPTRRPDGAMLRDIGTIVFDVQDVGVRYYTYLTTLLYVLEEAGRRGIRVVVLDRPNPITGRVVEGPLADPDLESFTAPHALPVRTGLTMGEFARMVVAERRIPVNLTVVAMSGWDRARWFDETGLPWVNPSPNIRSVTQALLYAGIGLLEATNLSVGRGTDMPFEVVGAPWIDPVGLADALNRRRLRGVRFEPVWFTPTHDRYGRVACGGVRFVVTDREAIRPVTVGLTVASALRERHREQWRPESIQNLLVNRVTMWAFLRSEPIERLLAWADIERSSFLNRRASYLIYR